MGKFLDFLLILITGFIILTLFPSCGTISTMKCDRLIGPEKEECVRQTELIQRDKWLSTREKRNEYKMGRRKY